MYPRHRLDLRVRDVLFGLAACLWAWRRRGRELAIIRACAPAALREDELLACLSVRSGFDLLLGALALPSGSEVLVSAVTHPDMVRIIGAHGLRAVPVDLDVVGGLGPRPDLLEKALTPRTRAILVAHLFGGRASLGPAIRLANQHGLLLLEDCAQAFEGLEHLGHPLSDASMFSFGTIKTASAAGGALLRVRDPALRDAMRLMQDSLPVQSRRDYARRLLKALLLILVGRPVPYRFLATSCGLLGCSLDAVVNGAARAFPSGAVTDRRACDELFRRIRRRPSAPLLALLARRLRTFDAARLARRASRGEEVARGLPAALVHPGAAALARTHWLFPVVAPDPDRLVSELRERGFDASRATSNIAVVEAPPDRPHLAPREAERMMSSIVFLPVYPELPDEALRRLLRALAGATEGAILRPGA